MMKGSQRIGRIYGLTQHRSRRYEGLKLCGAAFALALITACTPMLYSVDMKYVPTDSFPKAEGHPPSG